MKLLKFLSLLPLIRAFPLDLLSRSENNDTAPRVAIYVQTFHDQSSKNISLSLLPLLEISTRPTHIILASLHLQSTPGDINLNDNPFNDPMYDNLWVEVKILQQYGIKVMAMMGGAANGTWNLLAGSDSEFSSYYNPLLNNVIKEYNLDGFDIDIEQWEDISVPLRLVKQLYTDMGPSFSITMAPVATALKGGSNLSGFSYTDFDAQAVVYGTTTPLISWYNAQFDDGFGSAVTVTDYQAVISAGWDPWRVAMTVPTSSNDAYGWVDINTLKATLKALHTEYPGFGGVVGWEYFDAGSSDGIAQPYTWVQQLQEAFNSSYVAPAQY